MDKSTFIDTLRVSLETLSKDDRNKFISYYEEIIEDYMENGLEFQEVVEKIGSPESIANSILSEQDKKMTRTQNPAGKIVIIGLLILGFPLWGSLVLTVALLILSAYIVIWCVPFTTGVSAISFFVAAIVSIAGAPFLMADTLSIGIVQLGVGISSVGIALLLGDLTVRLSINFIGITKRMTVKGINLFKRKVERVG